MFSHLVSIGQGDQLKFDKIIFRDKLENEFFLRRDTFRDDPRDTIFGYDNKPIRSNIHIEETWGQEELIFCDCHKSADTLIIETALPGVCCFYNLNIKLIQDQFAAYLYYEDDIDFIGENFYPKKQSLLLQKEKDRIKGFIDFESLEIPSDPDSIYPYDPESKSPPNRKARAKGFFVCDLRRLSTLDNYSIVKQLKQIHERDQMTRRGTDSIQYASYFDSTNLIAIEKLTAQYGWLNKSFVGIDGNRTCFLVIQHADLATQEKYLPMMEESVAIGESNTYDLALLQDRVLMRQGKNQIYGSQVVRDESNGQWKFYPIEDEQYVNARRAKVGLQPIEEDAEYFGIDFKVEQKPEPHH